MAARKLPTREGSEVRWNGGSAARLTKGEWRWVDRNERVPATYLDDPDFEVLNAQTFRERLAFLYQTAKNVVDEEKAKRTR